MSGLTPLGFIALTTGTPVVLAAARLGAQTIALYPHPSNAGIVYVGLKSMDTTSGAGVLAVIAKPANATTGPFTPVVLTGPVMAALLDAGGVYVSGATNDKILGYVITG